MSKRKSVPDPLEARIEAALEPGWFIDYRDRSGLVSELEEITERISKLASTDHQRAVHLYETFLAGCYELIFASGNVFMHFETTVP